MKYHSPHYENFSNDFQKIAKHFSLNSENLEVEFYTPRCQAIFVEEVDQHKFKIHISLEEDRIISVQQISNGVNGNGVSLKEKYRRFMK